MTAKGFMLLFAAVIIILFYLAEWIYTKMK